MTKDPKSTLQLFECLWGTAPQYHSAYSSYFKQIILNGEASAQEREVNAGIRYMINEDGEKVSPDEAQPNSAYGVVHLVGPMVKYGNWWFWGADELVAMLDAYDKNLAIKGIILKVDSGGGHVSAVPVFLDFMARKSKPVVTLGDTVASAAMWVAASTDYIMASNDISAMFGSIGVMVNFFSFKKYYKELGIEEHTIYSTHSDDKNKPFEEALKKKYELIKKEHLDPLAVNFQNNIKRFRGAKLKLETPGLLSGKMFYTNDALENGLADGLGNEQLAIKKINELAAVQTFINNY